VTTSRTCPTISPGNGQALGAGRAAHGDGSRIEWSVVCVASLCIGRDSPSMDLTADMQRVVLEQRLGFVATVTPDGAPNLSPKGTTIVWDDQHLMFADIASPGTVANIASNPRVEINVVDPIVRKGYRFKGTATAYTDGPMFDRGFELLRAVGSTLGPDRVRSIVVIEVTAAAALLSPAYDDGTPEAVVVARWLQHHADLHASPD
jgi:predicted pyridoxine 5'-phosphate oxidase superfamily flavin-nucleotide-binding protein